MQQDFTAAATHELEQSVIGAILMRPDNLALLPKLETSSFQNFRARAVWDAIRNLEAKSRPIDTTTIGDELGRVGKLDAVGWDYLGECSLRVPTVDNAVEYARRLRDAALRRRLLESLGEIMERGREGASGEELLTMAHAGISVLDAEQPEEASEISDIVARRISQLEEIAKERLLGHRTLSGFPTGVAGLDEKIGGWQPGIVTIVAARPAMGKSSLGLATADASTQAGFGVHLFSLEDTEDAYADRVLARTSLVPAETIRNAELDMIQMQDVGSARRAIAKRRGWLVDGRSGITADEIVRSVRRRKRTNNTRVVIVDYVQLVKRPPRVTAHEGLTEIMTTFADAAKHDGLAYIVMSQLNREIEKRDDKRPLLSDLRESGSLEERAKCVVGIYRGCVYHGTPKKGVDYSKDRVQPPDEKEFRETAQLLVLKNSNGRTGRVFAKWNGPLTRIS